MKKRKKLVPITAIILMSMMLVVLAGKSDQPLSVDTILRYTPQNEILAAGLILVFFALKSLTIIFPLSILYLANGILFDPFLAVMIGMTGLAITITIPYLIGRISGGQIVQDLCKKYPKVEQIREYQETNTFFACFITRIVGILPGDIVSIYFGACHTCYPVYLIAGIAGSLLSIITNTLLGEKLSDPFSKEFVIVFLCRIAVSAGAIAVNYRLNQRKIDNGQRMTKT